LINLGSQYLIKVSKLNLPYQILGNETKFILQMLTGTIAGFVFKFIADKYYIFKDLNSSIKHTAKQVIIYTFFAVITTIIFWGAEMSFNHLFEFANRDLIGGFIGLIIGYTIKFFLDKKWVFRNYGK